MTPRNPPRLDVGSARKRVRQEGAVMLVVMLILLVVTAGAAVSVHTTQSELQAAGQDRLALQTAYVSEAAIMTTMTWIDVLGDTGQWLAIWDAWSGQAAPDMTRFGEPPITALTRHNATRTIATQQMDLQRVANQEFPPLTRPPSGAATPFDDAAGIGSFGPRQAYELATATNAANTLFTVGYVVDVTDCALAPSTLSPGAPVGGGTGSLRIVQFYCVLTARGRVQLPGVPTTRPWSFGAALYNQDMFMSAHDSRATILTPEMLVPAQ